MAGTTAAIDHLAWIGREFGHTGAPTPLTGRRAEIRAGLQAITLYERELIVHLLDRLAEIPGIKVYGITDRDQLDHRTSIVSFTMEWATPTEAATHLGADGIQVWDGDFYAVNPVAALGLTERGGLLRVGLMSYNTKEEIDRLISSLKELAKASGVQIG
jgi:selenocysteine lyase/cysteine desulfurase